MTNFGSTSRFRDGWGKRIMLGVSFVLAFAIAMPEELPAAAPMASAAIFQPMYFELKENELVLAHCCHSHPLPPYTADCCHSGGAVVVVPAYGYGYGAASVRGQSRRVARRTSRRVSRRR